MTELARWTVTPDPGHRLRRLRRTAPLRALVRETRLHPRQFVAPLFVQPGRVRGRRSPRCPASAGSARTRRSRRHARLADLGVGGGAPLRPAGRKDAVGTGAWIDDGIVQEALRRIARAPASTSSLIADVCLCEYTDHGHCGVLDADGAVDNDATLAAAGRDRGVARRGRGRRRRPVGHDGRPGRRDPRRRSTRRASRRRRSCPTPPSPPRRSTARSARPPTRRPRSATAAATRWTRPTARGDARDRRSTSTRAPTCSWSSRRCRTSTYPARPRGRFDVPSPPTTCQRRVRHDQGRRRARLDRRRRSTLETLTVDQARRRRLILTYARRGPAAVAPRRRRLMEPDHRRPPDGARSRGARRTCIPGGVEQPGPRLPRRRRRRRSSSAPATGPRVRDVDGRRYIDYIGSWGPPILGHAHPRVVAAVRARGRSTGIALGAPTRARSSWPRRSRAAMPSIELVRFVISGTEATMSALRLARGATGRDHIVKFAGCYHGHADGLLVKAGSGVATLGDRRQRRRARRRRRRDTSSSPYNDLAAVARRLRAHPGDGSRRSSSSRSPATWGSCRPSPGFLEGLRELTRRARRAAHLRRGHDRLPRRPRRRPGASTASRPDLTTLGKIIGGGLPVGAYGGPARPHGPASPRAGPVYQAGTLSGNPLAMAAGLATLRRSSIPTRYAELEATGARRSRPACARRAPRPPARTVCDRAASARC